MTKMGTRGGCVLLLAAICAAVTLGSMAGPPSANAGSWTALQCASGNWSHEATAVNAGTLNGFSTNDTCGSSERRLGVYSYGGSGNAAFSEWKFTSPTGTYFSRVRASGDTHSGSSTAMLYTRPRGGGSASTFGSLDSGGFVAMDSGDVVAGDFGVRLACNKATNCTGSLQEWTQARDFRMTVVDDTPPDMPMLSGGLVSGGWKRGDVGVEAALGDTGGGVAFDWIMVNGELDAQESQCDPEMAGSYTVKLQPCPSTASHSTSLKTSEAPWREGSNSVSVCAFEYGSGYDGPACRTVDVNVDNEAPGSVEELTVNGADETDWTALNEFDLSWENPAQAGDESPLDATHYRVREPGGTYDSGRVTIVGSETYELENLTMPHSGRFEVSVWKSDAAGNTDESTAKKVTIKFDDTAPGAARPEKSNGWLNRVELAQPYEVRWDAPRTVDVPPSGIGGYVVVVDSRPNTDPCDPAGIGGNEADCAPEEISHLGIDNNSIELVDLPEGSSFVHVVAVSGSGVRSGVVGHSELRVDRVDPETLIRGVPGTGWTNQDVALEVSASDEGSGMFGAPNVPGDLPPATSVEVDGVVVEEPGDSASRLINTDGIHRVRYWARDLAGNENDGVESNAAPGLATVRLDKTPPAVAFANAQSPSAPNVFRASYSDVLSGAVSGEIALRKVGSGTWMPLDTRMGDGELVAAANDAALDREAEYEFRAMVTDAAGNVTTTNRREDGSKVIVRAPFKAEAMIDALTISGKARKARIGYSKQPRLTGRLVDRAGKPVEGAPLVVSESYVAGSKRGRATAIRTTSGAGGRFELKLPKGPSRSISVSGVETPALLAAEAQTVRLVVKGKVRMSVAPRRVEAGGTLRFRGKVLHRQASIPKGGKRVEIQVRIGKRWDVVDKSLKTKANGKFALDRRLGRFYTRPTVFIFRAVVLREAGWAYRAPVRSKKLRVTVMPR